MGFALGHIEFCRILEPKLRFLSLSHKKNCRIGGSILIKRSEIRQKSNVRFHRRGINKLHGTVILISLVHF